MARIVISLEFNQKISSTLSLLLVLLLSTLVALLTVKAARDIIGMAQNAPALHTERRVEGSEMLNVK